MLSAAPQVCSSKRHRSRSNWSTVRRPPAFHGPHSGDSAASSSRLATRLAATSRGAQAVPNDHQSGHSPWIFRRGGPHFLLQPLHRRGGGREPQRGLQLQSLPGGDEIGQGQKRRIVVHPPLVGNRQQQRGMTISFRFQGAKPAEQVLVRLPSPRLRRCQGNRRLAAVDSGSRRRAGTARVAIPRDQRRNARRDNSSPGRRTPAGRRASSTKWPTAGASGGRNPGSFIPVSSR